jgi:hypothetical protein
MYDPSLLRPAMLLALKPNTSRHAVVQISASVSTAVHAAPLPLSRKAAARACCAGLFPRQIAAIGFPKGFERVQLMSIYSGITAQMER